MRTVLSRTSKSSTWPERVLKRRILRILADGGRASHRGSVVQRMELPGERGAVVVVPAPAQAGTAVVDVEVGLGAAPGAGTAAEADLEVLIESRLWTDGVLDRDAHA